MEDNGDDSAPSMAPVTEQGFAVRDASSANWVIRRIVEARAYGRRVRLWADVELKRAQREEQFLLHRFGAELEAFARRQIDRQHDGRKSVSLPSGTMGFRTEPLKLSICDEQTLLRWCRTHLPSAIRTTESAAKSPLMQHVKTTGECPQGARITGGNERFYVR